MFSMKDLETITNKSSVAIRNLMKKNEEFRNITEANIIKSGRLVNYGEPVLEWLLNYYHIEKSSLKENSLTMGEKDNAAAAEFEQTPPLLAELEAATARINELEATIEKLTEERNQINETLIAKDNLITQLMAQNGQLLLLLSQEKQEKQLLLPQPRKPLLERLRNAFKRNSSASSQE